MDAKTAKQMARKVMEEKYGKVIEQLYSEVEKAASNGQCSIECEMESDAQAAILAKVNEDGFRAELSDKSIRLFW